MTITNDYVRSFRRCPSTTTRAHGGRIYLHAAVALLIIVMALGTTVASKSNIATTTTAATTKTTTTRSSPFGLLGYRRAQQVQQPDSTSAPAVDWQSLTASFHDGSNGTSATTASSSSQSDNDTNNGSSSYHKSSSNDPDNTSQQPQKYVIIVIMVLISVVALLFGIVIMLCCVIWPMNASDHKYHYAAASLFGCHQNPFSWSTTDGGSTPDLTLVDTPQKSIHINKPNERSSTATASTPIHSWSFDTKQDLDDDGANLGPHARKHPDYDDDHDCWNSVPVIHVVGTVPSPIPIQDRNDPKSMQEQEKDEQQQHQQHIDDMVVSTIPSWRTSRQSLSRWQWLRTYVHHAANGMYNRNNNKNHHHVVIPHDLESGRDDNENDPAVAAAAAQQQGHVSYLKTVDPDGTMSLATGPPPVSYIDFFNGRMYYDGGGYDGAAAAGIDIDETASQLSELTNLDLQDRMALARAATARLKSSDPLPIHRIRYDNNDNDDDDENDSDGNALGRTCMVMPTALFASTSTKTMARPSWKGGGGACRPPLHPTMAQPMSAASNQNIRLEL